MQRKTQRITICKYEEYKGERHAKRNATQANPIKEVNNIRGTGA